MAKRDCPHCGGTGKVDDGEPDTCECGHYRIDHVAGYGCTICSVLYGMDCERFRAKVIER